MRSLKPSENPRFNCLCQNRLRRKALDVCTRMSLENVINRDSLRQKMLQCTLSLGKKKVECYYFFE